MWQFVHKYLLAGTITWAFVIFILCATPGQYIPSYSWLDLLSFDKFVHAGMFFILCSLGFLLGRKHHKAKIYFYMFFLSAVLYGISLEWMQANLFVNRSADINDIIANSFGSVCAVFAANKLHLKFESKIKSNQSAI